MKTAPSRSPHIIFWLNSAQLGMFGVLPVVITVFMIHAVARTGWLAVDFGHGPWVAGRELFAGVSPYIDPRSPLVAHGSPFVYPAVAAFLLAPLSLLSRGSADVVFVVVNIAAALLTLRVLNVRDWRLYGLILFWPTVISGWQTANVTLPLGLGVALLWRHRDRPLVAGGLVALLISVKMFVWPLGLWLLATRRFAAARIAVAFGLIMNLVAWGLLGFDQVGRYARLMDALTEVQERRGYSLIGLGTHLNIDHTLTFAVWLGFVIVCAIACVAAGWRGRSHAAFVLAVVTCLLATPIIWLHYFGLLLVPMALARPRLSLIWFAPLVLLFPPSAPGPAQIVATLLTLAAVTVVVLTKSGPFSSPRGLLRFDSIRPHEPVSDLSRTRRRSPLGHRDVVNHGLAVEKNR